MESRSPYLTSILKLSSLKLNYVWRNFLKFDDKGACGQYFWHYWKAGGDTNRVFKGARAIKLSGKGPTISELHPYSLTLKPIANNSYPQNMEQKQPFTFSLLMALVVVLFSVTAAIPCVDIPDYRRFIKGDDPKLLKTGEKIMCNDGPYDPPTNPPPTTTTMQTSCPCACTSQVNAEAQCYGRPHCWVQRKNCPYTQKMCCC